MGLVLAAGKGHARFLLGSAADDFDQTHVGFG